MKYPVFKFQKEATCFRRSKDYLLMKDKATAPKIGAVANRRLRGYKDHMTTDSALQFAEYWVEPFQTFETTVANWCR